MVQFLPFGLLRRHVDDDPQGRAWSGQMLGAGGKSSE